MSDHRVSKGITKQFNLLMAQYRQLKSISNQRKELIEFMSQFLTPEEMDRVHHEKRGPKPSTRATQTIQEKPMNEQQWEEIKIEDVQPGDVARCNGREFPVLYWEHSAPWVVKIAGFTAGSEWFFFGPLGFTFWRKVKREPRTWETTVFARDGRHDLLMLRWHHHKAGPQEETRVRVTEILDGEDGA